MKNIILGLLALSLTGIALTGCFKMPTQEASYTYSGDSTGGTATYTDAFGNKKTCRTLMIGQSVSTYCD